jgi:hypothetical protein
MNEQLERSRTKTNTYVLKELETNFLRDKVQNDFLTLMNQYKFHLFHLSVTWIKTYLADDPKSVNQEFSRFYRGNLVPELIQERRLGSGNRPKQPIAVCFIEEGDTRNKNLNHSGNCLLLHHHCLIAARHETASRLHSLSGVNTLKSHFTNKKKNDCIAYLFICTSDLKEITNPDIQLRYASKNLWKFREESMLRFNYPINWERLKSH